MRQVLFILIALAICLLIAKLLPNEGEMGKTLRAVFYVLAAALGLLFVFVLVQAAIGGI
ncbi:MAG: hypothetical protein AAF434_20075 [Pseudomonadota bacterium]